MGHIILPSDSHFLASIIRFSSSKGSRENWLSAPPSARERVKCFQLLKLWAIEATATPIPIVWSLKPTSVLNNYLRWGMVDIFVFRCRRVSTSAFCRTNCSHPDLRAVATACSSSLTTKPIPSKLSEAYQLMQLFISGRWLFSNAIL